MQNEDKPAALEKSGRMGEAPVGWPDPGNSYKESSTRAFHYEKRDCWALLSLLTGSQPPTELNDVVKVLLKTYKQNLHHFITYNIA